MKLFEHSSQEAYARAQIRAARRKRYAIWTTKSEMEYIANRVIDRWGGPVNGVCHGVRMGWEVKYLKPLLIDGSEVWGTEISDVCKLENVLSGHDFHDPLPEKCHPVRFAYSNSLDHARDPKACLQTWKNDLTVDGVLFLHWTAAHESEVDEVDCFSASRAEYRALVAELWKHVECRFLGTHRRRKVYLLEARDTP